MQLLAERLVQLQVVDGISDETVRRTLKKAAQALVETAVVHCSGGADFVWRMEDVLTLYEQPMMNASLVCVDERPCQLIDDKQLPAGTTGQPKRYDYHYQRHGTCNLASNL